MNSQRKTKIVATIGPASLSPGVLDEMIDAGMTVARVNMSHGTVQEHLEKIQAIREASARCGKEVAILADLPGPKIRAGKFPDGGTKLTAGQTLKVFPSIENSTHHEIHVDYPTLLTDVEQGNRIILGDGSIAMTATAIHEDHIEVEVISGGTAQGSPGVHLAVRNMTLRTPTATDLMLASRFKDMVDYLAVSFVCSNTDLDPMIEEVNGAAQIVAKIETYSAMCDLEAIVNKADAVMVARGDLGLDCPIEDVPILQKTIISTCNKLRKPVITATQMLETMITAPTPTRAEVSDVANAVLDGTDAVMLSGETAIGADPANVVETMSRIAQRAETVRSTGNKACDTSDVAVALARAAVQISDSNAANLIVVITEHGNTANAVSNYRPDVPVLALSPEPKVVRQMNLLSGVEPMLMPKFETTDDMITSAVATCTTLEVATAGDTVVVVSGAGDIIRVVTI